VGLFFYRKEVTPMITVKSLSYSTVSQYVNCSQRVYYEKIEHLPKKNGMSSKALFGISLHAAVAAFFRGILNHVILDLEQLVRVFRIRNESWPPKDVVDREETIDGLCQEAKTLLEMFLASKPPTNIIGIEKPIQYALTSTLGCVGQVDLLIRDADGVLTVIDVKSTSKTPAEDQIDKYKEQCLTYAMAFHEPVKAKAWLFLRRKKNPEYTEINLDLDNIEYSDIIGKFTNVAKAIATGIHFRNRGWMCSSCPYSYMCKVEPAKVEQQEYREAA
jgi:CRISPR/Cas system-associated exonuclease Cas4 (RecB family)